ncbi:MAG: EamA family transporter, partial [Pseudomonadota bacterium]|nr:EamA family transporter [Pseudomonadota bacterium]
FNFSLNNLLPIGTKIAMEPHILGGLGLYVISVGVWIMALSRVPVSIAYPMLSIGYIVNALAAWYWLGESITPVRVLGMAVIIIGVYLVARS